ncbi:hypothetical protein AAF712_012647, partial [Marasmius tenuissimus]
MSEPLPAFPLPSTSFVLLTNVRSLNVYQKSLPHQRLLVCSSPPQMRSRPDQHGSAKNP